MKHAITTTTHNFRICTDCALIIAYDDWSVLDGSYPPCKADQREAAIKAGLAEHGVITVDMGGPINNETRPTCDCCGIRTDGTLWPATKGSIT